MRPSCQLQAYLPLRSSRHAVLYLPLALLVLGCEPKHMPDEVLACRVCGGDSGSGSGAS